MQWTEATNSKLPDIQQHHQTYSIQSYQNQNQVLHHPKSLYRDPKRKHNRFTPDPIPSYGILPPIIQQTLAQNPAHKTHFSYLSNLKTSNVTPDELIQTSHHFPQGSQTKPIDWVHNPDWETSQEIVSTIRKNDQSSLIGYRVVDPQEIINKDTKIPGGSAPWKQKIMKSAIKDQLIKGIPFKKANENPHDVSVSMEKSVMKNPRINRSRNPSMSALEISGERNNELLNGSMTGNIRKGVNYSPEKVKKQGIKTKGNDTVQRLLDIQKSREEEKLRNAIRAAEEAQREIALIEEQKKKEKRREEMRRKMFVDITKKKVLDCFAVELDLITLNRRE